MRRAHPTPAPWARRRLLAASTLAGLLVLGLTAACNNDNGDESVIDDNPPSDTTPVSTEPTSEPATPKEKAAEAAKQAIRDYYRVSNATTAHAHRVSEKVFPRVAVYQGINELHNQLVTYRREGIRTVGTPVITDMKVRTVKLAYKPNQQPPLIPTVVIDICNDVSEANVVDKTGHSVVDPSRPDSFQIQIWVYNYDWPDSDGWKVGDTETELKPCTS
jgi:hypothetical protein